MDVIGQLSCYFICRRIFGSSAVQGYVCMLPYVGVDIQDHSSKAFNAFFFPRRSSSYYRVFDDELTDQGLI